MSHQRTDNLSGHKILSYGRQFLDDQDRHAVMEVLESDWLTQGPMVPRFEKALSAHFGVQHAIVASSGTAALHLAALCLGWGPGDIVIVPAITFLATANCCAYVGAEPYFVDIDDVTMTIDPTDVEKHVKLLQSTGRRVRAVIGVDMAGHPCDWPSLRAIADRYGLQLLDDACHAIGGSYSDVKIGSSAHSNATILSFHPVKHITTGEGGAILTNDHAIAEKAARLRNHGTVRGADHIEDWEGPWQYDMTELGYNFRLTDLQCALGLSQLRKLQSFTECRRAIAQQYNELLSADRRFRLPAEKEGVVHSYHLYIVRTGFDDGAVSRREFFARCQNQGILLQVHYRPVVMNSYYRNRRINQGAEARLPVSMRYYRQAISLPIFPQLKFEDVERVCKTLHASLD